MMPTITIIRPRTDTKSAPVLRGTTFLTISRSSSSLKPDLRAFQTLKMHQIRPTRPSKDTKAPAQTRISMHCPPSLACKNRLAHEARDRKPLDEVAACSTRTGQVGSKPTANHEACHE